MTRIPFSFDEKDGFITVKGTVFLQNDALIIETTKSVLDLIPYGRDTFAIPAEEIESIEVETGLVKHRLVVRPFSFEWLDGFPGDPAEEIALPIKRKHTDSAEALARETRLRNLPR
ncbi:MAG: hypothetical protein AAF170_16380 [Bacteroidota bacterium]